MAHQLVLLINLIGLLVVDALFLADINITQDVPSTMEAGSEVRVTMNITKGDLGGFAKLQLDLPPGMSVTAIETKGASFTFADQKAKFIWMALPSGPSFKISYTLGADATASGSLNINGRLSFIEDNERKTYDLPTATVLVTGGTPTPVVATITEPIVNDPGAMDLVSAAGGAPVGTIPVAVIDYAQGVAPIQGPGNVGGSRTITPLSAQEMMVEVVVRKGDIRGFGKLQEAIPAGFMAVEHRSGEAIFTAQDRVVKFVWLNLPSSAELNVSYKLRSISPQEGQFNIDGEFGYLLNDETQKAVLGTSKFFVGTEALKQMAQQVEAGGGEPIAKTEPKDTVKQKTEPEPVRTAPPAPKPKPDPPVTEPKPKPTISGPEKGILYKVQITAAHREVGRSYFQARHKYGGEFSIERHQGWIKYVTGRYANYKEARDQRVTFVQAGHNFPGPFVTAYNNGERITVQEALLISNQKWVQ